MYLMAKPYSRFSYDVTHLINASVIAVNIGHGQQRYEKIKPWTSPKFKPGTCVFNLGRDFPTAEEKYG